MSARKKIDEQDKRLLAANGEPVECVACKRKVRPDFDDKHWPTWHYSCRCGAWAASVPASLAEA